MATRLLYKLRISGRVQGVGFRWSVAKEAQNTGIGGFVKNLSDGSVYIEAEGLKEQLENFVDWCRSSPGLSEVESVDIESGEPVNYTQFRIEH